MAEQSVTLAPGESKVVSFEATPHEARSYQVSVNGLTGSFIAVAPAPAKFVYIATRRSLEIINSGRYYVLEEDVQNIGSIGGEISLEVYCQYGSFYPPIYWSAWEICRGGLSQYEVLRAYINPGEIVTFRKLINFYDYFERANHTIMRVKIVSEIGEIEIGPWKVQLPY
ncbi:unnamed protein product [marine sediment metagenome]|uniref:Uncharacterized protein n=1 Tax=marine sediment metagenome TaxID=412755 RepID=X1S807_9ZZZZ